MTKQRKKTKNKKLVSMRRFKTRREMNIGILIFALVFVYLIVTIWMYATSKKISVYEVREGSIVKDNSYTGLVLREEMVVPAETSGYVSYFQNEGSKVKAGSSVYALSPDKLTLENEEETLETALNNEELRSLTLSIQNFNENFNSQKFSSVYSLKNEYSTLLQTASNRSKTAQINEQIAASVGGAAAYPALRDGIIVRTFDGYEEVTEDTLKSSDFDRSHYESHSLEDQMEVAAGEPVYKLVTDETWNVYVELSDATAKELADTEQVKTRIDKDSETIWADFSILQKDGTYFGKLTYTDSMIRYCEDRYLHIELIMEDESGLKIPKSAVVEKPFYMIPKEYLTSSGSGSSTGIMIQKDGEITYQDITVYAESEDGYVYVNPNELDKHTVLVKPESTETFRPNEKRTLQGVYNINKGYAVFEQVHILCENDAYYIVEENTAYGLKNYDHIVQDGTTVEEDEVVFQ